MELDVVRRLAVALVLGLVVGAERGWQTRAREEGRRVVGLRTFGLVGLVGGVAAILADAAGSAAVLAVAFGGLVVFVTAAYAVSAPHTGDYGATTELAVVLTFALGALAAKGFALEAAAAAVVTAALLSAKTTLHRWLGAVEQRELHASLQLLLIAAVALPLLPDRGLGPWGALNPRTLGLFVLLIAGISFVGYLAVRLLGERRGLLFTALFGGLTSSTAVTVAFARMARRDAASRVWLAAGIGVATATMAPRLLLEVAAVHTALVPALLLPMAVLTGVPLVVAAALARAPRPKGDRSTAEPLRLRNPLELGPALVYGALLAALFLGAHAARATWGDSGIYALALLSGLADVDAVSLSLARMAAADLSQEVAVQGIVLAALSNTAVKAILAALVGGWALGRWSTLVFLPTLVAAAVAAVAIA